MWMNQLEAFNELYGSQFYVFFACHFEWFVKHGDWWHHLNWVPYKKHGMQTRMPHGCRSKSAFLSNKTADLNGDFIGWNFLFCVRCMQ